MKRTMLKTLSAIDLVHYSQTQILLPLLFTHENVPVQTKNQGDFRLGKTDVELTVKAYG
jgi:hypothetical protein